MTYIFEQEKNENNTLKGFCIGTLFGVYILALGLFYTQKLFVNPAQQKPLEQHRKESDLERALIVNDNDGKYLLIKKDNTSTVLPVEEF